MLRLGRDYQGARFHKLHSMEWHAATLLPCESLHVLIRDDTIHELLLQVPLHPMQRLLASPGIQLAPRLHHPSELGHLARTNDTTMVAPMLDWLGIPRPIKLSTNHTIGRIDDEGHRPKFTCIHPFAIV